MIEDAADQPLLVWPPTFVLQYAYLDQLQRSGGLSMARLTEVRGELARIQRLGAGDRSSPLNALASELDGEAGSSSDAGKVRMLTAGILEWAAAQ